MELRSVFRVWKSPGNKQQKILRKIWEEKGQEFSFDVRELEVYPYHFLFIKDSFLHLNLDSMDLSNHHRLGSSLFGFSSIIEQQLDFIRGREYEIKIKVDGKVFHEQSFRFDPDQELVFPWVDGKKGSFILRPLFENKAQGLTLENEEFMLLEEIYSVSPYETERFYEEIKNEIFALCDFNLDILNFVRVRLSKKFNKKYSRMRIKTLEMFLNPVRELINEYSVEDVVFQSKTKAIFECLKKDVSPNYHLQKRRGDPSPLSRLDSLKLWTKKIRVFFL